jgi:mono/diheme cytochrome c family protein
MRRVRNRSGVSAGRVLGALLLLAGLPATGAPQASPTPAPNQGNWDAPLEAKQLQNPVKLDGQTVERGKKLYRQHCVPCHGESGVGDGAMAKKLGYKPANLTLERLNLQADGEIFWKVSKGKQPMPAFEKDLSQRERWDVVSYVRTLLRLIP